MPPNRLSRLPTWISHWLGYREKAAKPLPAYIIYISSFIGAFCGLALIQAVLYYGPVFAEKHVMLIASFGASAVLCYGSIELPLAQPRNVVFGNLFSAIIGVGITKFFLFLPANRFTDLIWLSSSISTATAIVFMQITKTTHPPGGATAIIPLLDEGMRELGWYYIAVVVVATVLILVSALLVNNMARRYPMYWISPDIAKEVKGDEEKSVGMARAIVEKEAEPTSVVTRPEEVLNLEKELSHGYTRSETRSSGESTLRDG